MFKKLLFFLLILGNGFLVFAQEAKLILPIGHLKAVNATTFSPDGKFIVSTSYDGTVKIWDSERGILLKDITAHSAVVYTAAFNLDGSKMVTASGNGSIIWDTCNFTELIRLDDTSGTETARFSADGKKVVSTLYDGITKVWDSSTGKLLLTLHKEGESFVDDAFFSPDGTKIFTLSRSDHRIWDAEKGTLLYEFQTDQLTSNAQISPNGALFAFAGDTVVKIRNLKDGKIYSTLIGHHGTVNHIVFDQTNKYALTAAKDSTARMWDVETGQLIKTFRFKRDVEKVIFTPNGKSIIGFEKQDYDLKFWNLNEDTVKVLAQDGDIRNIVYSPNGKKLVVNFASGLSVLDANTFEILTHLNGSITGTYHAIFTKKGDQIITGMPNVEWFKAWDLSNAKQEASIGDHTKSTSALALSHDGKKVATGAEDQHVEIWDFDENTKLHTLIGHTKPITSLAFSSNDQLLASSSWDKTVRIWDVSSGKQIDSIKFEFPIRKVSFSPDNKKLLILAEQEYIYRTFVMVYDIDKTSIAYLNGIDHKDEIKWAVFSPDGKKVLTASLDKTAKVYDLEKKEVSLVLKGHTWSVMMANYSPNGKWILTNSYDRTAKLWDASTGALIRTFNGHTERIWSSCFSSNNKYVLTASGDETMKIWDTQTGKELATLYIFDEQYMLMKSPSGYYMSSRPAARKLNYITENLGSISFEQLDVKYNRPDKVLESLHWADKKLIDLYKKAYDKRIKRMGIDTTSFRSGFSIPKSTIKNKQQISDNQEKSNLKLQLIFIDKKYNLDRFNVWVNECPMFGTNGENLKIKRIKSLDTVIAVNLSQGKNIIEVSVTNSNGTESYRESLAINYNPIQPQPEKIWFVGLGIDNFAQSNYNLKWSKSDILNLEKAFKARFEKNFKSMILLDKNLTKENILKLRKKLIDSTAVNDKVIVAYSGHGLLNSNFDYYLSTYAVDFNKPEKNGIPYEMLESLLDGIPARKKLMFIDACHSGELDKDEAKQVEETKKILGKKGVKVVNYGKSKDGISLKGSYEIMTSIFNDVSRATGTTIISAAAGTQFALEKNELKAGVFTYFILEKLKENKPTLLSELKNYIIYNVAELTNGLQIPTTRKEIKQIDWEVW